MHAAGKKMADDVLGTARVTQLVLDAGTAFLREERQKRGTPN